MKKFLTVVLSVFMVLSLAACGLSNSTNQTPTTKEASGKDYEAQVFTAFWEAACSSFGVNYSDYKWTHTATSYISDSTTSDGYTAHYYLIKTAFDTENVFGQKINHEVTARCYYVPDYSNVVYTTYLTLDGEKILFDEETEDWLLGIGGSSANVNDTNVTTSQNEKQPTTTLEKDNNETPPTNGSTTSSNNKPETTPHSHSYGNWSAYDAEQHKRTCTSCSKTEYANHNWNKGNVAQVATCSSEGIVSYSCSICSSEKTESIEKVDHIFSQKVESSEYLKSNANYSHGTRYYYSCSCGAKGSECFELDNRSSWISASDLENDLGVSVLWTDEVLMLFPEEGIAVHSYRIEGVPKSGIASDTTYSGSCEGKTIRVKYSGKLLFYYADLVSVGII